MSRKGQFDDARTDTPSIRWLQDHDHLLNPDEFLSEISAERARELKRNHTGVGCPSGFCGVPEDPFEGLV